MRHYYLDDYQWELAVATWAEDLTIGMAEVFTVDAWNAL